MIIFFSLGDNFDKVRFLGGTKVSISFRYPKWYPVFSIDSTKSLNNYGSIENTGYQLGYPNWERHFIVTKLQLCFSSIPEKNESRHGPRSNDFFSYDTFLFSIVSSYKVLQFSTEFILLRSYCEREYQEMQRISNFQTKYITPKANWKS